MDIESYLLGSMIRLLDMRADIATIKRGSLVARAEANPASARLPLFLECISAKSPYRYSSR